ncbi:tetratricopeptide repeat protein [Priestia megaterium]|uniref:tetratricopeptide repeat protein n=1 Tax=Priestia megaterium TaxID=1404 RepID=UPI002B250DC7|nr:tetratricopeptide repeat protein [Priestia megaterium]MEB2293708.1 tetratricopeptide repeat protein [Priestia megaterium]
MSKYDEIDFEEIALEMQKQVEQDPHNVKLRNELAIVLMETNEYEEAFFQLQTAAKIKPSVQTLYNLAYFYFTEGKPIIEATSNTKETQGFEEEAEEESMSYTWEMADKEAFDIVEDLLKNKPGHYFIYNLMGEMYIKKEKYEEAINVLKKGIHLTPSLENLNNLGLCYYKKGMLPEAAECFHKAHPLRSCNNYSLFPLLSYGICLAQLGRGSEARKVAKELLFLSEKEEEALEADIAEIYYILGDYEEFVDIYSKLDWDFYSEAFLPTYFYSLWKLSKIKEIEDIASKTIQRKEKEIKEVIQDPDEEEDFKDEYEEETMEEITFIKNAVREIYKGKAPIIDYKPQVETRCYLYGCFRHTNSNPNYFSI